MAINTYANAAVYAGWPIVLQVTIAITDDDSTVTFSPSEASVQLFDASGAAMGSGFAAAKSTSADPTTLNADNDIAGFSFYLTPEQSATLSGSYQATYTLGDLTAKAAFTVTAEPTPLSASLQTLRRFAFCDFYLATGGYQQALDLANLEIAAKSDNIPALSRAASALEGLGRTKEAIDLLSQAIKAVIAQNPKATEPPKALYHRYSNLLSSASGTANQ